MRRYSPPQGAPTNAKRCVTELHFPTAAEQELLDTGVVLDVWKGGWRSDPQPILFGERAVRQAMELLGIEAHDQDAFDSLLERIGELEAENEKLEAVVDAIDAIESADFRARRKAGRPKQKVEAA